jgi:hypothetical protein
VIVPVLSSQHVALRDPPGPEREEHREHDRELLGQYRHREGDTGQHGFQPVAAREAVDHDDDCRQTQPEQGEIANEPVDVALQQGALGLERAQCGPDLAQLGGVACGAHLRYTLSPNDQCARVDPRRAVAARGADLALRVRAALGLAHRHRLARQQRLVDAHVAALEQDRVRRHAVAFREQYQVAANDLPTCDAMLQSVADHESAGTRHVAQRIEGAFGLALLVQRDADDHEHEHEEEHGLLDAPRLLQTDEHVDDARGYEQ